MYDGILRIQNSDLGDERLNGQVYMEKSSLSERDMTRCYSETSMRAGKRIGSVVADEKKRLEGSQQEEISRFIWFHVVSVVRACGDHEARRNLMTSFPGGCSHFL